MALTFNDDETAKLIGHVYGGKDNQKKIYISFRPDAIAIKLTNPFAILTDDWFRENKKDIKTTEIIRLQHCILRGKLPEDEELEGIYDKAVQLLEKKAKREIFLDDGRIVPTFPKENKSGDEPMTLRTYTCGSTGSGKTQWLVNMCKEIMMRSKKKKKIYVFSVLDDDKKLDEIGVMRVKINDDVLTNPIELKELTNCITIFDDIESFRNKKYRNAIASLRDTALSEGRHHGVQVLCTNHQITNYAKTREMLLECEYITFFPKGGGLNAIIRLLKSYIGLDKDEIDKVLNVPSRWVTIINRYPICCIYETGIFLLGKSNMMPKYTEPLYTVNIKGDTSVKKKRNKKDEYSDDELDDNDLVEVYDNPQF